MAQGTTTRAEALAAQFVAINDAIIDAVSNSSADQWQRATASESWSVGVVAHHVLAVQHFFSGILNGLSAGETRLVPLTSQEVDENNARHAREFAGVDKQETLLALRESGRELWGTISGLDDTQLARIVFVIDGQELTAEQVIEFGLIGHFQEHLASIRAALAA